MTNKTSGWHSLINRLGEHKLVFALTVFLGLANLACAIAASGTGAWIVGRVAGGATTADLTHALILLASMVGAAAVFTWLESWLAHDLAYRVLATLRGEVYEALTRLAPAKLVEKRSGDVVSTAMADVETLEWFYAHSLGALFTCTIIPILALGVLYQFHPILPLLLLPLLVLAGMAPGVLRKRAKSQGEHMRARLGELNAEVIDAVQGLRELTVFDAQKEAEKRLFNQGKRLVGIQLSYGLRAGLENGVSRGFAALGMLATLTCAAALVSQGSMEPTLYPVAVILAGAAFGPTASLSAIAGQFGGISAAADRVFGLIGQEPQVSDPVNPLPLPEPPVSVHFHEVSFRYNGASTSALEDVSFSIRPGETVALAGHSGAGKSTIARLLMRYYDPNQGLVLMGGRDLRSMKLGGLRGLVALVPQDIYLFNLSMADNIRLGRPEASDREVETAARLAAAHHFISSLPQGYQTMAGDRGLRLSGGQRQRIAVARAFLSQAPILIMDEAVSNLDVENERALQKAWDQLRQDRATLIIAHRLSSIEAADRVIVLDGGRIVEEGPPAELLRRDGPLSTLVQAQLLSRSLS